MKKIILASMIACAAAFTACGDDDNGTSANGSSKVSCDIFMGSAGDTSGHLCLEFSDSETANKFCATQNTTYSAIGGSATVGTGCPSGAKLECPKKDGGKTYIYGIYAFGESCDTFDF